MITIVDYGLGNLASIKNMIKKVGGEATISSNLEEIGNASKLILPGVGAFNKGMENISNMGLQSILNKKVLEDRVPILGICLGMQLLTNYSEEGDVKGLGWIDAKTARFRLSSKILKVPHMGWADISINQKQHPIFSGLEDTIRYYFVHSYYVRCKSEKNVLCTAKHEIDFACGIVKDNIIGFQFHPEKSHKFGMTLLKNYIDYC